MAYSHSHTVEAVKELMLTRAHYYSPNSWTSLLRASNKPSIGRLAEAAGAIFNYSNKGEHLAIMKTPAVTIVAA